MSSKIGNTLGVAIGAAFIGSLSLSQLAAASPAFQASDLASGYMLAAAGEGKCGEGKCGVEKMDANKDGKVSMDEAKTAKMADLEAHFKDVDTNGDGFDYSIRGPRPWHGIQWLENLGEGRFAFHRVGDLPGAYAPSAADLNGDGFVDLVAVSGFADWTNPDSVSVMAWLNDGHQNFTPIVIAHKPTQLITAAVGDLDGDGIPEIITGGCRAFPIPDNLSNITLWRKK